MPFKNHSDHSGRSRVRRPRSIRTGVCLLVTCILLSACAQPQLNSERIERKFGSYGVEVLESSASRRVSNLYSLDGERRVCRTLALVLFENPSNAAIVTEQRLITAGGSIGRVFKENGWSIHKINLQMTSAMATKEASLIAQLMDVTLPTELAVHIYRFQLQRNGARVNYAIIAEIHHPDYLSVEQLKILYSKFPSDSLSAASITPIMTEVRHILLK